MGNWSNHSNGFSSRHGRNDWIIWTNLDFSSSFGLDNGDEPHVLNPNITHHPHILNPNITQNKTSVKSKLLSEKNTIIHSLIYNYNPSNFPKTNFQKRHPPYFLRDI